MMIIMMMMEKTNLGKSPLTQASGQNLASPGVSITVARFPDLEYMEEFFAVEGNTYPIKDQLKALGLKWHGTYKVWYFYAKNESELNQMIEKIKSIPNIEVKVDIQPLPQVTIPYSSFEELVEKAEYGKCILCGKTEQNMLRIELYKKTNTKLDDTYQGIAITVCSCIGSGDEFHFKLFKIKKILNAGVNRIERVNTSDIDDDLKNRIKVANKEYLVWLDEQFKKITKKR
jgi:hypothetical protein